MTLETKSLLRKGLLKLSLAQDYLDNYEFYESRRAMISSYAYLQQVATIEEMNGKPDTDDDNEVSEQGC